MVDVPVALPVKSSCIFQKMVFSDVRTGWLLCTSHILKEAYSGPEPSLPLLVQVVKNPSGSSYGPQVHGEARLQCVPGRAERW